MQQSSSAPGIGAATFYANLVDIPITGGLQQQSWQPMAWEAPSEAQSDKPQQMQPELLSNAAATADPVTYKPVKFAQPFVLDPNTGVVTLPAKASNASSRVDGGTNNAAFPQPEVQVSQPRQGPGGSSSTAGRQQGRYAAQLEFGSQASRYRTNSINPQQQLHPAAPAASGSSYKRPIDRSNVGYQLLRKAGWQEGKGVGRGEQGMAAPLQVQPQKGNMGLGFAHQKPQQAQHQAAAGSSKDASAKTASTALTGPALGSKRVAALLADELAKEDLDTKVKRHKQVMEQEDKDKRDKAIQEYLRRAFNEISATDIGGDSNPLQRRNRLTSTNPLVDSDED